jgi:integrase
MKGPRFPVSIRRGSVVTRVYRLSRGDGREVFTAAWNAGGRRLTRQFSSYAEAHAEASLKADQLAAGKVTAAAQFHGDDAAALVEARSLCGGTPLVSALKEWARARDLTGGNVIAAAETWKARNTAKIARVKVPEVVAEFCRAKTKAGFNVADDHSSIFDSIKADFAEQFIDSVSAHALDVWLAKRENPVSRNTYRKRIVSVWRWAQKRGYLPRDVRTEAEQTERAREEAPEIGIINAATWAKFLELVRAKAPADLAVAVVAGFCGLRRAEIHGQVWEDIDLAEKFLRVTKAKRGTPARRLVPLCDAAIEWLMLCGDRTGPICEGVGLDRVRKLAREASPVIELPENCFRHAFISHRVAQTGNIPEVSIEAGNSPQVVVRHYRELVTKYEGQAWFAIHPESAAPRAVRMHAV